MRATRRWVATAVTGGVLLSALALQVGTSSAGGVVARAEISDEGGTVIGEVVFKKKGPDIVGIAEVMLPTTSGEFHGFHIHANDNAANGDGCVVTTIGGVDSTDFVSADGHWKSTGQDHGAHDGDLPVLMRGPNGRAKSTFLIGKFTPDQIIGGAVIIHVGPDNYANIPSRYQSSATSTPGPDADTLKTGDAGLRYACGVIHSSGDKGKKGDD